MIIGIDASRATVSKKTGVEHYSEKIIYHISKIDKNNQYILYSENKPKKGDLLYDLPKNFIWRIIPFGYLWTQIRLSWEMLKDRKKLDILFIPSHTIPLIHPKKTVVTVHDFGFDYFPELYAKQPIGPKNPIIKFFINIFVRIFTLGKYGNSELDYHRWASKHSVKKATKIIAVSEFTKNDAIKLYNATDEKIAVIYHGFDSDIKPLRLSQYKINSQKLTSSFKPYIFYIGRVEKKKNILNLVKSYQLAVEKYHIPHKLVLAGMPGLGYEQIKNYIEKLPENIKTNIILLGYVSDKHRSWWMQNADMFLFISNFEGFGIPILEAFQSEIPVICSNTTSLPEVAGESAILVNPKDPNEIAKQIFKLYSDKNIKKQLVDLANKRVQMFSWDKAARQTLETIINSTK